MTGKPPESGLARTTPIAGSSPPAASDSLRVAELERELQAAIQRMETGTQEQDAVNAELTARNRQLQETLERQRLISDDLQNVLYSTNVGTLFLDMDLRIRFYTPAIKALFSVIAGDIGRPLADLRPIADDPDLLADARRVLADKATVEREIGTPDGAWYVRRIFPYRAHDERIEGVVITFADVTDRKHIARALEAAKLEAERANLAKSRFLAAASHDLRQPLQSLTLLQTMLLQSVPEERPRKLLHRQEQALTAMSGMLNALLDINQIEAGAVEPHPVAFPINELLSRLREEFSYLAQARGLSLRIVPCPGMVSTDPRLLEQMLRNLLGNALKYTRKGGILIGCRPRGGTLRIEVWDTGIGIAAADLPTIFEEFHQVDNPARERTRGQGLGLSIVHRLGRLLEAEIDVRSAPGRGSRFAVAVPRAPDATAPPCAASIAPAARDASAPACQVMVVDDDLDVLELLAQLLQSDGHSVSTAPDGANALAQVANGARPDLLLTDYNLPGGINGLDLVAQVRSALPPGLPAIVLTGDISRATMVRIAENDCLRLNKPVKPDEITAAIARLCPPGTRKPVIARAPARTGPVTYLVDDDPRIRVTLAEVLEHAGRTVRSFASAEDFLAAYPGSAEGCLLVDAHLPGMSGVDLLGELRRRNDSLPTILITGSSDVGLAVSAMRTGACDFIEKPVGQSALLASVARAIDQSHDSHQIDAAREAATERVTGLTARQRQIMDLVLAGHPSKNIAADLGISQRTVENHRAAVMQRMGVRSLPELARCALAAVH